MTMMSKTSSSSSTTMTMTMTMMMIATALLTIPTIIILIVASDTVDTPTYKGSGMSGDIYSSTNSKNNDNNNNNNRKMFVQALIPASDPLQQQQQQQQQQQVLRHHQYHYQDQDQKQARGRQRQQKYRSVEEVSNDDDDDATATAATATTSSTDDDDIWSWMDYAEQTYYGGSGASATGSSSGGSINSFWNNFTQTVSETDPNFSAVKDVSVDAVVASLYFNGLAFICLMIFYEILRHYLPAVYSSKKRLDVIHSTTCTDGATTTTTTTSSTTAVATNEPNATNGDTPIGLDSTATTADSHINNNNNNNNNDDEELNLPDERPLDWIRPVLGVPWQKVREMVGLDGYFFLRYIRMNVRITAISTFWLFLILVPVYFYGGNEASNLTSGWYRISAANLSAQSNLMWVPCIALYFFTGFIFFVIQQEYEHYFNIRQDFLAKGSNHVHPQHHYSVLVENIPDMYQSDVALAKYFESLFPNSVHSAVVVLNVPDLTEASNKCMRTCRRLEKSIAYWNATGKRPTHIVGRARMRLLGIIDMAPLNCPSTTLSSIPNCHYDSDSDDEDDHGHHKPSSSSTMYTHMTDGQQHPTTPTTITTTDGQQQAVTAAMYEPRPPRGTRVDSISYYTQELAAHSRTLFRMQQRKIKIANEGAQQLHNEHLLRISELTKNGVDDGTNGSTDFLRNNPYWLDQIFYEATQVADQILDDSEWDNALITPPTYDEMFDSKKSITSSSLSKTAAQQQPTTISENTTSTSTGSTTSKNNNNNTNNSNIHYPTTDYGSMSPTNHNIMAATPTTNSDKNNNRRVRLMRRSGNDNDGAKFHFDQSINNSDYFHATTRYEASANASNNAPFTKDQYKTWIRRWLGRLGLDFIVFVIRYLSKHFETTGTRSKDAYIMSRTGFVTFLDLASTTTAASAPLTSNRNQISGSGPLEATLAPEPREIIWANAHVSKNVMLRRERFANLILALGVILWSFPLAAIQAFAKAENLAQIPGMEWIFQINNGYFTTLVNGYLPVVALLGLILILPVLFEYIAVKYERRKTLSDVQASMLGRYFYYQLANIYVSVTAGSILRSLAEIIENPSSILKLLGKSIPLMVGYFIALLVTKILSGLPMVFLRFGALVRMLVLLILSDDKKLTQRELDAIYRLENVQYGWEFPTQLLTVVIVFTYAVICPIILPFGLLYFMGALMVYKKQVLYVYSPVYESGGAMFPLAVQRSLFGLVCAQMTFWGYVLTRGCYYQPVFLFPLPILTIMGMNHLYKKYAVPSEKLSLERARHCDRRSSVEQQKKAFREGIDEDSHNLDAEHVTSFRHETGSRNLFDHGVAARRSHFDTSKYRQPVLTEVPTEPWFYRRGQAEDTETLAVRAQLRQINRYIVSLSASERKRQNLDFGTPL